MAVERIEYSDSLRQGTDKLNEAIDQSNEAISRADATEAIANQALANSEDTQQQLNTIVIDGDSSVEAAQARVSTPKSKTFDVLKDRLDESEQEFITHNAETVTGIFNVKTGFGAKGDGVTDDTDAINAAIAAAVAAGGGIIYFPRGTYIVSSSFTTITSSGIYFEGSGLYVSIIKHTSDTDNFLTFGDESLGSLGVIKGVGISNLSIKHNSTRSAGYTIKLVNAQLVKIKDLYIENAFTMFELGSATDTNSNFVVVEDIIGNCRGAGIGIDIRGGVNGIHLLNVQLNNENQGAAIQIVTGSNGMDTLFVDNCLFQRFDYGILAVGSQGTVQNAFITTTIFDGIDLFSVIVQPTGSAIYTRFVFDTCWFTSTQEDGVVIDASSLGQTDGIYFSNCRWITVNKRGLVINSQNPINVELDNCIVSGCSQAGSGLHSGIQIAAGATKFSITNNRIGEEGQTTTNQAYGIELGINCDLYTITNNDLIGNVTGAISDAGGTFTKKIIRDNLGYNPTGNVTAPAIPSSTVAQSNTLSFPVQVFIYGGTVTGISKNGTNISGMTNGQLILLPGETVAITYSAAPSWTWFGV